MNYSPRTSEAIIRSYLFKNLMYSWGNRKLALAIGLYLVLIVVATLAFWPVSAAKETVNQYIPVNAKGQAITPIPGHIPIWDEQIVTDWTAKCIERGLSFSPGLYRRHYSIFVRDCMTPAGAEGWGQELGRSGYLGMVKEGSIIDFDINQITLEEHGVVNGVYQWRFVIDGRITRYMNQTYQANSKVIVVVHRRDPFNYEKAIAIKQVIL